MEDPKASLDDSLCKTKEIVVAVHQLKSQQEEAEKKTNREIKAHVATKERLKALEAMLRERDEEAKEREVKLQQEVRAHQKACEDLQRAKDDAHTMNLQNEAMKVEIEAREKAYVVNANWAARFEDLKGKFDRCNEESDQLLEENTRVKSSLQVALHAQEEYRQRSEAAVRALEATRDLHQEELAKRDQLAEEVTGRLSELESIKAQWAAEAVIKNRGKSKALGVLERTLAQGDKGLVSSSFAGWSTLAKTEKTKRMQKDRAMKRACRTIANEGSGLMSTVFGLWSKDVEKTKRATLRAMNEQLEGAKASASGGASRAHQRAIAQLEKQFAGEDQALVMQCFVAWKTGRAIRQKKEQASQKAARKIANSDGALKAEILQIWNGCCQETRAKKRAKDASTQKALRMIANSDNALRTEAFNIWLSIIEKIRQDRKGKEAGTAKAMRMMANSDTSLTNVCFDSWAKVMQKSRETRKMKEQSNKKALRMIANSDLSLTTSSMQAWASMCSKKKQKEQNTAKAVRMIASSNEALQAAVFSSWADDMRKKRDKSKKMKAMEKTLGASDRGLQMLVVAAWHATAQADARRKRAKERSMKTAMKSITGSQQILQVRVFLTWVREGAMARLEKLQKLLLQAQVATQEAEKIAGTAQNERKHLREELESLSQQHGAAQNLVEELEMRLAEAGVSLQEKEKQLNEVLLELEDSRRKARDIGDELSKVGIFLQNAQPVQTPRRISRPKSGSGEKGLASPRCKNALPPLQSARGERESRGEHRPRSGVRKWSKCDAPMPPPAPPTVPMSLNTKLIDAKLDAVVASNAPMSLNTKLIDSKLDAVAALEAKLEAKLAWTAEDMAHL